MRFKDRKVDTSGVDDLRGRSGRSGRGGRSGPGLAIGGGAGLVGLVVVLLFTFLGGSGGLPPGTFDISQLDPGTLGNQEGTVSESDLAERCITENAIEKYNDCYLVKVYNETDEVWAEQFAAGEFGNAELPATALGVLRRLRQHRVRWGQL